MITYFYEPACTILSKAVKFAGKEAVGHAFGSSIRCNFVNASGGDKLQRYMLTLHVVHTSCQDKSVPSDAELEQPACCTCKAASKTLPNQPPPAIQALDSKSDLLEDMLGFTNTEDQLASIVP